MGGKEEDAPKAVIRLIPFRQLKQD